MRKPLPKGKTMDNLIFCLERDRADLCDHPARTAAARPELFSANRRSRRSTSCRSRKLLPILLFRDIAAGRITEQFDPKFFFFSVPA